MKLPPLNASATIKIAIGVVAGIVVLVGGFFLVQNLASRASDTAPRDLIISNITSNGAKIAWTTDQEIQGVVEYGSSPTSLNLFAPESQKTKKHLVDITLLSPATSYYFQIRIGDTKFDNGGVPWTFSTKIVQSVITDVPSSAIATGSPTIVPTAVPGGPTVNPFGTKSLKVIPTLAPTVRPIITLAPTLIPTLVSTIIPTPTIIYYYCVETDCVKLCQKLKAGTGECSTYDYQKPGGITANDCRPKVNWSSCTLYVPTPTWNPLTPTLTPSPTLSITNTPTPTPSPTISVAPTSAIPDYMRP